LSRVGIVSINRLTNFHVEEMCVSGVEILTFLHQNALHRKIFLWHAEPFYRIKHGERSNSTQRDGTLAGHVTMERAHSAKQQEL
jgi:hypothetical protein